MTLQHCFKRGLAIAAAAVSLTSATAASPAEVEQFQAIVKQIDVGGTGFYVCNTRSSMKVLDELTAQCAAQLEAMPASEERDVLVTLLTLIKQSGLSNLTGLGGSDIAIADASPTPLFRSRSFLQFDRQAGGLLWQALFPKTRDLSAEAAQWPDTTVAAVNWQYDAQVLTPLLEQLLARADEADREQARAVLRGMTGPVTVLVFQMADEYGIMLDYADFGIPLPTAEATDPVLAEVVDGRFRLYLPGTAKAFLAAKREAGAVLSKTPAYEKLAAGLPLNDAYGLIWSNGDWVWLEQLVRDDIDGSFDLALFRELQMPLDMSFLITGRPVEDGVVLTGHSYCDTGIFLTGLAGRYLVPALLSFTAATEWSTEEVPELEVEEVEAEYEVDATHQEMQTALADALRQCVTEIGNLPTDDAPEVYEVLTAAGFLTPEQEQELVNCGFVYFGGADAKGKSAGSVPVALTLPDEAEGKFLVLYADGTGAMLTVRNVKSFKETISYLQSHAPMPEADFRRLIEKSAKFDVK